MYARVVRFTGADPESLRKNVEGIRERSAGGPPEGVPGTAMQLLADEENGTVIVVAYFATEEDMKTGDATLNQMSPPEGEMGTRTSVDLCEVQVDVSA